MNRLNAIISFFSLIIIIFLLLLLFYFFALIKICLYSRFYLLDDFTILCIPAQNELTVGEVTHKLIYMLKSSIFINVE